MSERLHHSKFSAARATSQGHLFWRDAATDSKRLFNVRLNARSITSMATLCLREIPSQSHKTIPYNGLQYFSMWRSCGRALFSRHDASPVKKIVYATISASGGGGTPGVLHHLSTGLDRRGKYMGRYMGNRMATSAVQSQSKLSAATNSDYNQAMHSINRFALPMIALFSFLVSTTAQAGEHWPRFRGENGQGVSDIRIPAKWTDKAIRWKVELPGQGHSSPVVWGNRVFLNSADSKGGERIVACIDGDSGKQLWARRFSTKTHKKHKSNSFATSTPACDAMHVYTVWATGGKIEMIALDHDGKDVWKRNLGPVKGGHGFGASPSVVGDMVILNNDQDGESSLLALDRKTGKTRWEVPRQSKRLTYSTPVLFESKETGRQLIFTNWTHGVTGIDAASGKQRWELDVFSKPSPERAIGSPIVAGDYVIATCGFVTKKKHIVAIKPAPDGSAKEMWRIERSVPHIPTPLFVDGLIYFWDEGGVVTCVEWKTGDIVYRERIEGIQDKFYTSPICAGNVIFGIAREGKVVALAKGKEFKVLAITDLDALTNGTPAIANGNLYVRTNEHLICVKGENAAGP